MESKEKIQLKNYQKKAIEQIMKKDSTLLSFSVGMGKVSNRKEKKKNKRRDTR